MSHHDAYSGVDAFGRDRRLEDGPGDGGGRRNRDHDRYDEGPLPLPPPRHAYSEYGPGGVGGGDVPRGIKRSYEAGGDRERDRPHPHHYQDYPPGGGAGGGGRYHADYRRDSGGGGGGERDSRRYNQYDDRGPPARRDQWQQPSPPYGGGAYSGDSRDNRDNRGGDRRYGSGGPDDHRSPLKTPSSQYVGNKRGGGGGVSSSSSSASSYHNQKKHNQGGKGMRIGPIQSFKSYMQDQKEDLSPEEFQRKYEEYQLTYLTKFSDAFFDATNNEEWFQERYNPVKIQEVENDCATWAAKESALLGESLHNNVLGTFAAMALDPPRGGLIRPQGGGGRDRRSGSFTAQTTLVEANDAVAGRHLFGHEDRAVYITGISATCSKKLFKAAVTNKLTTTRAAANTTTVVKDDSSCTATAEGAEKNERDEDAVKEKAQQDRKNGRERDERDAAAAPSGGAQDEKGEEDEDQQEEVFIPVPLRIVLSQPQWSPKNIDSFERSAWVVMPTASFAQQAVQALSGLRIDVPEQQPSMGSAPFVETPAESIRTSAFSIDARMHAPKAPIVMNDLYSHHTRVSVDTERALEMANLLDVQRNVPEDCRLKTLLEKPAVVHALNGGAPSYAAAAAATTETASSSSSSSNGLCGPTARLDFAIGYLRRVHFVAFYGGKRYRDEAHLLAMAPAIAVRSLPYVPATGSNTLGGGRLDSLSSSGDHTLRGRSTSLASAEDVILADAAGDAAVPTGAGRKRKLDDEDDEDEDDEEKEKQKNGNEEAKQQQGQDGDDNGEACKEDNTAAGADDDDAPEPVPEASASNSAPSEDVISALAPVLGNQYHKLLNQRKVPLYDRRVEVILSDLRARRDLYAARAEAAQAAADQVVADAVASAAAVVGAESTDSADAAASDVPKLSTEEAAAAAAEAAAKAVQDITGCNAVEDEASGLYTLQSATHAKSILANCKIDPVGKKSRCCFVTCNKLFKDAEFLGKHMRAKHPTFMSDEMHAHAVPYMKRRFNAEDMVMRPLPPVELEAHGSLEKHSVRHMLDKIQAAKAAGGPGGGPGSSGGGKLSSGPPGLHQQQQLQGGYQRQHQHPYAQGDFNNFQGGHHGKGSRGGHHNTNGSNGSNTNSSRRGGGGDARDRRASGGGGGEHYGPPPGLTRNAASAVGESTGAGAGAAEKSFQQPKSENNFARKMSSYLDVDAPKESAVSIDYGVALLPPVKRRRTIGKK